MLLSITTDSDSCSLEVSGDLELENFKALCEAEVSIPSSSMTVIVNGIPLTDDKKTLAELGVKDGDLVLILKDAALGQAHGSSAGSSTSQIHPDVAQFDFSNIRVPASVRRAAAAVRPEGSSQRPASEAVAAAAESPEQLESLQLQGAGDDPAVLLDLLKAHPEQLARLSHNNPALAEAARKGIEEFTRVLKEQQEAKAEKERQRIRMLTADPFDAETQQLIASEIQKENIDANMEAAMEYNPESFGTVQMLYINCSVNGHPVKAFIDSGAQTTIMSEACARRCNIMRLVDQRWAGVAKGVGTQRIVGRVHMVQLQIEGVFLASSFCILQEQAMDMLLGLDMLKRHQMVIDLAKNVLQIGTTNTVTRFLSEAELPECARLTQGTDLKTEEQALLESEQQARKEEDEAVARALAASADQHEAGSSGSGAVPQSLPPGVTEADLAEIVSVGFTREEALAELQQFAGDKTKAFAALFAKKLLPK
ncbi:Ubiquitin domain [Trinorchestia longiramus]|nr:Ubiquitin domain [Trinorchestia longiramus]